MENMVPTKESGKKSSFCLTQAEMSIVLGIIQGKTTKEIAEDRRSAWKTVEVQRNNMLRKLRCHNMPHLINTLWEQKILPYDGDSTT